MTSSSETRVSSAFGRRQEPVVEQEDEELVLLPPVRLPPVRLRLEPEVDPGELAAVCKAFQDGIYAAARQALADAVRDFAAEQQAATGDVLGVGRG